jgi:hypothetical protein
MSNKRPRTENGYDPLPSDEAHIDLYSSQPDEGGIEGVEPDVLNTIGVLDEYDTDAREPLLASYNDSAYNADDSQSEASTRTAQSASSLVTSIASLPALYTPDIVQSLALANSNNNLVLQANQCGTSIIETGSNILAATAQSTHELVDPYTKVLKSYGNLLTWAIQNPTDVRRRLENFESIIRLKTTLGIMRWNRGSYEQTEAPFLLMKINMLDTFRSMVLNMLEVKKRISGFGEITLSMVIDVVKHPLVASAYLILQAVDLLHKGRPLTELDPLVQMKDKINFILELLIETKDSPEGSTRLRGITVRSPRIQLLALLPNINLSDELLLPINFAHVFTINHNSNVYKINLKHGVILKAYIDLILGQQLAGVHAEQDIAAGLPQETKDFLANIHTFLGQDREMDIGTLINQLHGIMSQAPQSVLNPQGRSNRNVIETPITIHGLLTKLSEYVVEGLGAINGENVARILPSYGFANGEIVIDNENLLQIVSILANATVRKQNGEEAFRKIGFKPENSGVNAILNYDIVIQWLRQPAEEGGLLTTNRLDRVHELFFTCQLMVIQGIPSISCSISSTGKRRRAGGSSKSKNKKHTRKNKKHFTRKQNKKQKNNKNTYKHKKR